MIPLELLQRFPFFSFLDDKERKAISIIAHELQLQPGEILFEANTPADALYFLTEGSLPYTIEVPSENLPDDQREYFLGYIHPEEILGISALIEPYCYTSTMRAEKPCRLIEINAHTLRSLCEVDAQLHGGLLKAVAKAAMQRLNMTRAQLAAHIAEPSRKQAA